MILFTAPVTFPGKIGITIDSIWAEPKTNKTEDIEAAERCMQMMVHSPIPIPYY